MSYTARPARRVQAWVVQPPDFDPAKKYPLLVLIHGGPQGAWTDGWTYRWNAQVFASAGYVVFMPNPRGSTGWGQDFTDDINGDWGGKAYEDVMKGTDFALRRCRTSTRAARRPPGASYGGYMVELDRGPHRPLPGARLARRRLRPRVDVRLDRGAVVPGVGVRRAVWEHPESYARYNPRDFVKNFKTPTLVIHGERDYRVPLEQGLGDVHRAAAAGRARAAADASPTRTTGC